MYNKLISGLFLTLFAVSAFAAAPAFEEVDADQDGAISGSEATAAGISVEAFVQADVDKDKQLRIDEFTVFTAPEN